MARAGDTEVVVPKYIALDAYRAAGGYQLLRIGALDGAIAAEAIIETLQAPGLRGLGGAGFPPGKKWEIRPLLSRARA